MRCPLHYPSKFVAHLMPFMAVCYPRLLPLAFIWNYEPLKEWLGGCNFVILTIYTGCAHYIWYTMYIQYMQWVCTCSVIYTLMKSSQKMIYGISVLCFAALGLLWNYSISNGECVSCGCSDNGFKLHSHRPVSICNQVLQLFQLSALNYYLENLLLNCDSHLFCWNDHTKAGCDLHLLNKYIYIKVR